jgi:hypothetical protein
MTVGLREVAEKRREWQLRSDQSAETFLGDHMIPVLRGPKGRLYVIDHHHLARALIEAGGTDVLTTVAADLSHLSKAEFWTFADNRGWCHPYDEHGNRRDFDEIPRRIRDLKDDPFRSLSGGVRRLGGYAKDTTPFAEFTWADFLRRRIKAERVESDFDAALASALKLAKSETARHLPGWCGPCD